LRLVCLHGFLGHGEDFNFLSKSFTQYSPNLDSLVHLNLEEIYQQLFSDDDEEITLVGYSFGARLAMQLFLLNPKRFNKLILFAGHMGLNDSSLIDQREKFENQMIKSLKTISMSSFINNWNEYDIFKHDKNIEFKLQNSSVAQTYFSKWGLSKQRYMLPELRLFSSKIKIFYGLEDLKYIKYAKESLGDFNVTYLKDVGHRVIQHEELVSQILKDETC
jgi:pimeloyl-ACP methyl ester carboxylesterase